MEVKFHAISVYRRCVNSSGEASSLESILDIIKNDNIVILNLKHANCS